MQTLRFALGVVVLIAATGCTRGIGPPPYDVDDHPEVVDADIGAAVTPGERVRVWQGEVPGAVGRVVAVDTAMLRVTPESGSRPVRIELQSIGYIERSVGTTGHEIPGLLIGIGVGALAGAAWLVSQWDPPILWSEESDPSPAYFVIPFVAGAALGLIIGHNDRAEVWEPVYLRSGYDVERTHRRDFWDTAP